MKFRKKPVVIEAVQFGPDVPNVAEIEEFAGSSGEFRNGTTEKFVIATIEGALTASLGDWIIKGVKGEFYPCKPDIFTATYEKVDE